MAFRDSAVLNEWSLFQVTFLFSYDVCSREKERRLSAYQLLSCFTLCFIQLLLANATNVFLNVKWKAALLQQKPHHQKAKTSKGVCTSQASHWTELYCLGFADKNDTKNVSVSLAMRSHYSNNAATLLGSSHHSHSQFYTATIANWPWHWSAVA